MPDAPPSRTPSSGAPAGKPLRRRQRAPRRRARPGEAGRSAYHDAGCRAAKSRKRDGRTEPAPNRNSGICRPGRPGRTSAPPAVQGGGPERRVPADQADQRRRGAQAGHRRSGRPRRARRSRGAAVDREQERQVPQDDPAVPDVPARGRPGGAAAIRPPTRPPCSASGTSSDTATRPPTSQAPSTSAIRPCSQRRPAPGTGTSSGRNTDRIPWAIHFSGNTEATVLHPLRQRGEDEVDAGDEPQHHRSGRSPPARSRPFWTSEVLRDAEQRAGRRCRAADPEEGQPAAAARSAGRSPRSSTPTASSSSLCTVATTATRTILPTKYAEPAASGCRPAA